MVERQEAAPGRVRSSKARSGRDSSPPGSSSSPATPGTGRRAGRGVLEQQENAGETSWWRWSTYFPTAFHPNLGGWNIFTQWPTPGRLHLSHPLPGPALPAPVSARAPGLGRAAQLLLRAAVQTSLDARAIAPKPLVQLRGQVPVVCAQGTGSRARPGERKGQGAGPRSDPLQGPRRLPETGLLPRPVVKNDHDLPRRNAALQALIPALPGLSPHPSKWR